MADDWHEKALSLEAELRELKQEYDDFQESSKMLETELEQSLENAERKAKELSAQCARLQHDREDAVEKAKRHSEHSNKTITDQQAEIDQLKLQVAAYQKKLLNLEQANETLERQERQLTASLNDASTQLNKVLEDYVALDSLAEDERERNQESIQRLKDEVHELKAEIAVLRNAAPTPSVSNGLARHDERRLPNGVAEHHAVEHAPMVSASDAPLPEARASPAAAADAPMAVLVAAPVPSGGLGGTVVPPSTPEHGTWSTSAAVTPLSASASGRFVARTPSTSSLAHSPRTPRPGSPSAFRPGSPKSPASLVLVSGMLQMVKNLESRLQALRSRSAATRCPMRSSTSEPNFVQEPGASPRGTLFPSPSQPSVAGVRERY
eukprot:TRINITY_DN20449_c0_g1_i1.p1 TRINITY_DN20449_c0_g1~~TRINITY_DN20449_c0_g1_i1.p1  ORF type:complete len:380 (-),score=70.81 TRINITY_DN20449_c0_g1_i1:74-1213(-)